MAHTAAVTHLSQVDPVMARLIRVVGPCTLTPQTRRAPFESLVRAIASQQLHGKAAESILRRFIALFPGRRSATWRRRRSTAPCRRRASFAGLMMMQSCNA